MALRQVLNTTVPLFVAISSFFLGQKRIDNITDYFNFLNHQLPKAYVPMLAGSFPLFALSIYDGENIWESVIMVLFVGYLTYYFIVF